MREINCQEAIGRGIIEQKRAVVAPKDTGISRGELPPSFLPSLRSPRGGQYHRKNQSDGGGGNPVISHPRPTPPHPRRIYISLRPPPLLLLLLLPLPIVDLIGPQTQGYKLEEIKYIYIYNFEGKNRRSCKVEHIYEEQRKEPFDGHGNGSIATHPPPPPLKNWKRRF